MDLPDFLKNLLIVVVLFKNKPWESLAITSLDLALRNSPAVPEIFIYDNSPAPAPADARSVTYIHDPDNGGVSRAYNRAALHAGKCSKDWMLFLDQDTRVESGLFTSLVDALREHPRSIAFVGKMFDKKGLVSPFRFSSGRGWRIKNAGQILSLKDFRFVNSGLFIQRPAFIEAGGYDERIPLDFSDISFGSRLAKVTDHFVVLDISVRHVFSGSEETAVEEALMRFHHFCTGALVTGKLSGESYWYYYNVFVRASRLCIRYKDIRFISICFQRTLYG